MGRWGRLLRLSLAPTAAADVAAGIVLSTGIWPRGSAPWLLVLASLCVYHGALALNDWADRERDRVHRPDRPIPSGAIAPSHALLAAALLLAMGPLLTFAQEPRSGGLLLAVALLAVTYDVAGRGPWSGPLLLALCRAGNLGVGLSFQEDSLHPPWLLLLFSYGAYVFLISRLGRLEDREDRIEERRLHPRWIVLGAALLLFAPPVLFLPSDESERTTLSLLASLTLAAAGAAGLVRRASASDWSPRSIQGLMGMALRRLLVFSAAVAVLPGTEHAWVASAVILCGYPLSHVLRRVFPPS